LCELAQVFGIFRPPRGNNRQTRKTAANLVIKYRLNSQKYGRMCSGCHTGGGVTQPSLFDFSSADASHATLVNQASTLHRDKTLFTPGDSSQSYLVDNLTGNQQGGARMPMRSAPLDDELITAVRSWIDQGAKRN